MIRIVKKPDVAPLQAFLLRLLAVVGALAAAAVIMALMGLNPFQVFYKMIEGSTMTKYRFVETFNKAIPLIVLSLGISVAFKMKFWNIGAEGQLYMGAFAAAYVAFRYSYLPPALLLTLMMLAGMLLGGLWALVPALLKSRFGTNETLVTLMMNYIAIKWVSYLQYGPWKDPKASGFPKIANFVDNAVLPKVFGVHMGWILALVFAVLVFLLLRYSKLGYEISVLGESETTARYAGIHVTKTLILAVLISGSLCGAAGMMQASAIEKSLSDQLSGGLGFTAIITTWLARLNPAAIVMVSFLFAVLLQGGSYIQSALQIPAAVAEILQGIILFFVLGSEFFLQYRVMTKKGLAKKAAKL